MYVCVVHCNRKFFIFQCNKREGQAQVIKELIRKQTIYVLGEGRITNLRLGQK